MVATTARGRGAGAVRPYSAAAVCTRPGDRVACLHPWLSAAGMQRLHHAGSRGRKPTSSSGAPAHLPTRVPARTHTHVRSDRAAQLAKQCDNAVPKAPRGINKMHNVMCNMFQCIIL
jgi:hypothetical protein